MNQKSIRRTIFRLLCVVLLPPALLPADAGAQTSTAQGSGLWSTLVSFPACNATETGTLTVSYSGGVYSAVYNANNSIEYDCALGPAWSCARTGYYAASDLLTASQFRDGLNQLVISCEEGASLSSASIVSANQVTGSGTYVGYPFSYSMTRSVSSATTYPLSVSVSGSGQVSSSPAGISCASSCSGSFNSGTGVVLTATAGSGASFAGWSGACSGTGACNVTMSAARSVTATFKAVPFVNTATSVITATSATISNRITFNAADTGKTGSVFITAMAPAGSLPTTSGTTVPFNLADPVDLRRQPLATTSSSTLMQLTASGWQPVVNGQLSPYASGVLGDQLATQSILDNADPGALKGAQFCVGYGTSAAEMAAAGRMQLVATIADANPTNAASGTCLVTVQNGWWWNPAESGRGFFLETSGNTAFLATYLYAQTGRATWYASTMQHNAGVFAGTLDAFSNGQSLTGTYRTPSASIGSGGNATITLTDATHATLAWAGGSTRIERLVFGDSSNPPAFQPQPGWWWYPSESGRGFSIEVQGSSMFLAGYMYDASGNPLWYLSIGTLSGQAYSGSWSQYASGQTMGGSYVQPTLANAAVGVLTIQFSSAVAGVLTLPDGRQIPIERFRF